jgi:ribosome biogenesis GTPase
MEGLVIKNTGSWYVVQALDGQEYNCKIKGTFRLKGIRTTNPIAVGDNVVITTMPDGAAYITEILPRRNYIIRKASNLSKEAHIIAANIDKTFLIITLSHPTTATTFIDRFLATAEAYRVAATIVINKVDLLTTTEDIDLLDAITYLYKSIGYPVIHTSAKTGVGLQELSALLNGNISLFSGNSGVGKSSLINAILPEAHLRTAAVSASHDTGMHTTTFSQMLPLPTSNGYLIDTPGVKGFGTIDFETHEVAHFFPEIFKIGTNCRYGNCTHTHEPGCAVLKAVESNNISQSRYTSYLSILQDKAPDKYRKPF